MSKVQAPFYLVGPKKGQPKLCKLCPTLMYPNHRGYRLCRAHYLAKTNADINHIKRNSPKRIERIITALAPPRRTQLRELKQRTFNGTGDYFSHLSPAQQAEAYGYLHQQMSKKPNYTKIELAQMVARATSWAVNGGPKGLAQKTSIVLRRRKYWLRMIAEHPERLPKGFDISMIPTQPLPR